MRPAAILALPLAIHNRLRPVLSVALLCNILLLSGCVAPPIENFPPQNVTGSLKDAASLVGKSSIPVPLQRTNASLPAPPAQEPKQDAAATESGAGPAQDTATLPSPSANFSTPVTAPSNESAEELQAEISIANPSLLQIYYYYSSYCPYSMRIKPFMERQQVRFENVTEWHGFDVSTRQGYYFFEKMANERNLSNSSRVVPLAIVDGSMFVGIPEINKSFAITIIKRTGAS